MAKAGKGPGANVMSEKMKKFDKIGASEGIEAMEGDYGEGDESEMPIPGVEDFGVGYDAKQACTYSECERFRVIEFNYAKENKFWVMGKLCKVPDQVIVEPVFATVAKTETFGNTCFYIFSVVSLSLCLY